MKGLVMFFQGQGTQKEETYKKLCESSLIAKEVFEEAASIVQFDLKDVYLNGDMEKITETQNAQMLVFLYGISLYKMFEYEFTVRPDYGMGHSLGEITALTCAEAINFKDAVQLVEARGRVMGEAVKKTRGAMLAIMDLDLKQIERQCEVLNKAERQVWISNYNASRQVVISGTNQGIERAEILFKGMGVNTVRLRVSGAFHSGLMQEAADEFKQYLERITYREPKWKVISNTTGLPYGSASEISKRLALHMVEPVRWKQSCEYIGKQEISLAIELGEKEMLNKFLNNMNLPIKAFLYGDAKKNRYIEKLQNEQYADFVGYCMGRIVSAINYNQNLEDYHKKVVEPYNKLRELYNTLIEEKRYIRADEIEECYDMVEQALKGKHTSTLAEDLGEIRQAVQRIRS